MTRQRSSARLIVVAASIAAVIGWGRSAATHDDPKLAGWTWAKSPRCTQAEENLADDEPCGAAIRLSAIAVARSGVAVVGGVVRGPIVFGPIRLHGREQSRGFIGRVDADGGMRVLALLEEQHDETDRWQEPAPTALVIDQREHVLVSRRDATLIEMNERGQVLRASDRLPAPARSLLMLNRGDLVATGCAVVGRSRAGQLGSFPLNKNGYVERLSPKGEVLWAYHFRSESPLDRSSRQDCGTGLAVAPDGDVYVAGTFTEPAPAALAGGERWPSSGSFLARFSKDGKLLWSRLIAANDSTLAVASLPGGRVAVTGNLVAVAGAQELGLRVIGPDGQDVWSATVERPGTATSVDLGEPVLAARAGTLFWAGAFRAPVKIGGVALDGHVGDGNGMFFARFDAGGKALSVIDVSKANRWPRDEAVVVTAMATSMSAGPSVWLAGTIDRSGPGAFLQKLTQ